MPRAAMASGASRAEMRGTEASEDRWTGTFPFDAGPRLPSSGARLRPLPSGAAGRMAP
jgi:hypothetical protein